MQSGRELVLETMTMTCLFVQVPVHAGMLFKLSIV